GRGDGVAIALHFYIQQKAQFTDVLTVQYRLNRIAHIVIRADIGEESQPAAVNAQHRRVVTGQRPRCAQQAAITTHHNHQIADFTEQIHIAHLHGMAGHHLCNPVIQHDMVAFIDQITGQALDGLNHLVAVKTADNADIAEFFHCCDLIPCWYNDCGEAPESCRLYHSGDKNACQAEVARPSPGYPRRPCKPPLCNNSTRCPASCATRCSSACTSLAV